MRLLFLSNFYPPSSNGGYEQLCQEVAQSLACRGHEVVVITSRQGGATETAEDGVLVHRVLHLEVEGGLLHTIGRLMGSRRPSEQANAVAVQQAIADFVPDAALIWGMWNVPRSVPASIESLLPEKTVYYLCDYWPSLPSAYIQRFQEPARHKMNDLPKRLLAAWFLPRLLNEVPVKLEFKNSICVSFALYELLLQRGVLLRQSRIIRNGIQLREFMPSDKLPSMSDVPISLIYAGRLSPEKGIHTAIKAVKLLVGMIKRPFKLVIVGTGDAKYVSYLRNLAEKDDLPIDFQGFVPREDMPKVLARCQILVFPSEWDEPLARTIIEAMASGLVVVGTTTGGTGEVLVEGKTGLTFEPGDAAGLANQIMRLVNDPKLRMRLAAQGQKIACSQFDIKNTVNQLESLLLTLAAEAVVSPSR